MDQPQPKPWQLARVVEVRRETDRAKSFRLALPEPPHFLAGQHYVLRLTAEDGYSARRSYSVSSAPDEGNEFEITVERLEDGEISRFLHDDVVVGDELEVRGPVGNYFVWEADRPALFIGGGSGVVPLMSMLRLARKTNTSHLVNLVASARSWHELLYAQEMVGPETTIIYTREAPDNWPRTPGRLTAADLPSNLAPDTTVYLCGSSGFTEHAAQLVLDAGIPVGNIRVEKFGPS